MRKSKSPNPQPPPETVQNEQETISVTFHKARWGWWAHLHIGRSALSVGVGWGRTKRSALRQAALESGDWFVETLLGPKDETVEVKV
jgi:hypothetical protein